MSSLYQAAGFIAQGKLKMIQKPGVNFVNINDIEIIAPIDEKLKSIIPPEDKILCSTFAGATIYINPIGSSKTTMYSWKTPVLICDNGVAFLVIQKFSQRHVNYVPMRFILWTKPRSGRTLRILRAAGFQHIINLNLLRNSKASRKEFFTYVDNLKPIWELKVREAEENIKSNLSKLDKIPKLSEYNRYFKDVPKLVYKRAKKGFKKQK